MAQFEAREIGARIAQARKEAGLTQEELAELAPFSKRSLQDYELGVTIPYRQLRDIGKLLNRPIEWFLHGETSSAAEVGELLSRVNEIYNLLDRKLDDLERTVGGRLIAIEEKLRDAELRQQAEDRRAADG